MSKFTFKPAVRSSVGLIVGLAGGTGSGKTLSAFRLAKGIAGDQPFAVIDTEGGRALHYADNPRYPFKFDHGDLVAPFRPDSYVEAIKAADDAGYPVIVVDSMSHVWAGDGGVLDWQEEEYERLGAREAVKLLSWSKPKQAHKRMVSRLLQCRAHLILCFRAEPHVEMIKEDGKTKVVPKQGLTGYNGWFPVCEKMLPFELTVSFMLNAETPGKPYPIKVQDQHKDIFPRDALLDEEAGRRIVAWANGGTVPRPQASELITDKQAADLAAYCEESRLSVSKICDAYAIASLSQLPAIKLAEATDRVRRFVAAREAK